MCALVPFTNYMQRSVHTGWFIIPPVLIKRLYKLSNEKFERLGSPLDEIVLFSVHKCYVVIGRRDVI